MTQLSPDLARLGSALEAAARADLRAQHPHRTRRLALIAAALAIAVPGVAIGASLLTDTHSVEQSMPAGGYIFLNTDPTCTVVRRDVEYHCVLAHRPVPEISDFMGTVDETVDSTQHVNGGCRSLRTDGLEWECYLGQAAVDRKIISPDFLGRRQTSPATG